MSVIQASSPSEKIFFDLLKQGWDYLRNNQLAEAMQSARDASQIFPESDALAHLLAKLAIYDTKYDIALALLDKSLINPTEERMLDQAQVFFLLNQYEQALNAINKCLALFGPSFQTYGLKAAVLSAQQQHQEAKNIALEAIKLKPENTAWYGTVAFSDLLSLNIASGFKWLTGRQENTVSGSRCPALNPSQPCELWIKNEQGLGDTLFYLRYAPILVEKGFKLNIKSEKKLKPLLNTHNKLFASVKEELQFPFNAMWFNVGDLPLAAMQLGASEIAPPLPLTVNKQKREKLLKQLQNIGPAPYMAVTWRAGPRGKKLRAGLRMYDKHVNTFELGKALSEYSGTIISIQRLPETDEATNFEKGLGKSFIDFSFLNEKLEDMLALLDIVDEYVTVPNTNVHLRAGLNKSAYILLNQPVQDWRWLADGDSSPWYPNMKIYRQSLSFDNENSWVDALSQLKISVNQLSPNVAKQSQTIGIHNANNIQITSLLELGLDEIKQHNISQAIKYAQNILQLSPKTYQGFYLLSKAALLDEKLDLALSAAEQAYRFDEDNHLCMHQYLFALSRNSKTQLAIQIATERLNQCSISDFFKSELYYRRANLNVDLDNLVDALKDYELALNYNPNHLDSMHEYGRFTLKSEKNIDLGFKYFSARRSARKDNQVVAIPNALRSGMHICIKHYMGLGDELTFLRYLPKLISKGIKVDYVAGKKLVSILERTGLFNQVFEYELPNLKFNEIKQLPNYDLTFEVIDLPIAVCSVQDLEIAPPLKLVPKDSILKKWEELFSKYPKPWLGITWRAGVSESQSKNFEYKVLNKHIPIEFLAEAIKPISGTVFSLQRNPKTTELTRLESLLERDIVDLTCISDDLEDALAIQFLLDENIGVSNTNMHLRAGLSLGSLVLVKSPRCDWRWGNIGNYSTWFKESLVYRQTVEGDWHNAVNSLKSYLIDKYDAHVNTTSNNQNSIVSSQGDLNSNLPKLDSTNELKLGWEAVSKNDISIAIKIAQDQLKSQPNNSEALHLLGYAAFKDNQLTLAEQLLFKAHTFSPIDVLIISRLLAVQAALMHLDEGLEIANQAISNQDIIEKYPLYYSRGLIHLQKNDLQLAINDFDSCYQLKPNHFDAMNAAGLTRLKIGDVWRGFKLCSARPEIRSPQKLNGIVCPTNYQTDLNSLRILIKRDMGFGDELTFLRYLPWLKNAGAHITYWCGHKLIPLIQENKLFDSIISDKDEINHNQHFDLTFWVNELPLAVENLNAPEIAPPFNLIPTEEKLKFWKEKLAEMGPPPYIGLTWRSGFKDSKASILMGRLVKSLDPIMLASYLKEINATWISLQRNVFKSELLQFEKQLNQPLHDVAGMTDNLDDLLAVMAILHENIGVSNTNMHLRAGVDLGSRVLVQSPNGDWRWGFKGANSPWFEKSIVYRENSKNGWQDALNQLKIDLIHQYGYQQNEKPLTKAKPFNKSLTNKIIWLSAGKVDKNGEHFTSQLASTRYRVIAPASGLNAFNMQSVFLHEREAELKGGWVGNVPQLGDTVIISKVFTQFSLLLAEDAKSRGAQLIVDFCDNHLNHPERGLLQKSLLKIADKIVVSTNALGEAISQVSRVPDFVISDPVEMTKGAIKFSPNSTIKMLWFGHAANIDTLIQFLPTLAEFSKQQPFELTIVTNLPNGLDDLKKHAPASLTIHYIVWSIEATASALQDCDLVIIPTLQSDFKSAKSPNRLLEPLWAGRMVVAGHLPAYLHFADSAWVGKNLIEGIKWCIENPQEVTKRIAQGQSDVELFFTNKAISNEWYRCIGMMQEDNEKNKNSVDTSQVSNSLINVAILTTQKPTLPSLGIRLIEPLSINVCNLKPALAARIVNNQLIIDHHALQTAEIIIVHRDFPSKDTIPLIRKLKNEGKKLVYETDDAFHLLPKNHPKANHLENAIYIQECAQLADLIITSTNRLAKEFEYSKKVCVVENRLSPVLWNDNLYQKALGIKKENLLRIGLIAGANHSQDIEIVREAINECHILFPQIHWVAYGDAAKYLLMSLNINNLIHIDSKWNYRNHPTRLAELGLDILLSPLQETDFNRCISHLKFLEAGFLGIATIASDLEPYQEIIEHKKNGLLTANSKESWIGAIQSLIDNPLLLKAIQDNARQTVLEEWMLSEKNNALAFNLIELKNQQYTDSKNLLNSTHTKEVAILSRQDKNLPSISIRIIEPFILSNEFKYTLASYKQSGRGIIDYQALLMIDIIIIQRDFPSTDTFDLLKKLKQLGKKLIYETDDAFHLIPDNHQKVKHKSKANTIFEFAKMADVITVSTKALAEEFKPYGSVKVLTNKLSQNLWNEALLNLVKQNKPQHSAENIRIGVVGGTDHQLDLALLTGAIKTIAKKNTNIHWVAYGDGALELLKSLVSENNLNVIPTNFDYLSHPTRLAEMALDIALVPLVDDSFNRCRSNLKFLEFGFLGVATVFSNVESYNTTVVDDITGLLVNNTTESWVEAIQKLIDNQVLREKIGANAQTEVQSNWMINSKNNGWKELLEKLV